jgi:hypothetical protein
MKLVSIAISYPTQSVTCQCMLLVQGNPVIVPFTVQESALYAAASARNKDTWENEDVCSVGSQIVGQPLTFDV